jgi:hypothetical protein
MLISTTSQERTQGCDNPRTFGQKHILDSYRYTVEGTPLVERNGIQGSRIGQYQFRIQVCPCADIIVSVCQLQISSHSPFPDPIQSGPG